MLVYELVYVHISVVIVFLDIMKDAIDITLYSKNMYFSPW